MRHRPDAISLEKFAGAKISQFSKKAKLEKERARQLNKRQKYSRLLHRKGAAVPNAPQYKDNVSGSVPPPAWGRCVPALMGPDGT